MAEPNIDEIVDRKLAWDARFESWYARGQITQEELDQLKYLSMQEGMREVEDAELLSGNIGDLLGTLGASFSLALENSEKNVEALWNDLSTGWGLFPKKKDPATSE
jgi:hypothetical protein